MLPCSSFGLDVEVFFHVWTSMSIGVLDGGMVFNLDHILIMLGAHVLLLVQAPFLPCSSFGLPVVGNLIHLLV